LHCDEMVCNKRCTTLKQKYKTSVLQDEIYFSFFSENTEK